MSVSDLKIVANRENAQNSTGPRGTPEGKKRSSLNATRHGLSGQIVVMPYEDLAEYDAFVDRYIQGLIPKTEPEKQLALDMANTVWKLNRGNTIENGIYAMGHHDHADENQVDNSLVHAALTAAATYMERSKHLENLSRQQSRLRRDLDRSTKLYNEMQDRRRKQERIEMYDAAKIAKTHKMEELPYNPADDGFVLSKAEIDLQLTRDAHLKDARLAESLNYNIEKFRAEKAA